MATYNYNEWNEWNILPLSGITLKYANNNIYNFSTMEASTEFKIGYLLEDNDMGGKTPVAVKIVGSVSVVQNNIKDFKQFFLDNLNSNLTLIQLLLYNPQNDDTIIDVLGAPQYGQTPRSTLEVENYEIIPDFSANSLAPEVKFTLVGYLGLEIINTYYDYIFQQSWS